MPTLGPRPATRVSGGGSCGSTSSVVRSCPHVPSPSTAPARQPCTLFPHPSPACASPPRLPAAVPTERSAWQQPQEAFTISERGRGAAAVELAKDMQLRMKQQGCKEEFVPNADLLADGLVDFLPAAALSPEELERQRQVAEATAKATR